MANVTGNYSNTTDDPSSTLEALNEAELNRLVPVIVYLVFLSVSGTFGNVIVCHVYRTKYRASNSKYFVLSLCVIDIFSCLVSIPLEIATVLHQYTFDDVWLCKTSRFSNYISAMSSSWLIAFIAVERYRKVCKPFKWQISMTAGKYLSVLCIVTGVLSSIPAIFIFGKKSHYVPRYDINGTECSTDDSMSESALPVFHVFLGGALFAIDVVFIVVLYISIGHTLLKHEEAMPQHFRFKKDVSPGPNSVDLDSITEPVARRQSEGNQPLDTNENTLAITEIRPHNNTTSNGQSNVPVAPSYTSESAQKSVSDTKHTGRIRHYFSTINPTLCNGSPGRRSNNALENNGISQNIRDDNDTKSARKKPSLKHMTSRQASTRRTALLMFTVSVAFVISYTPHLILMFCRLHDENFVDDMSDNERAAYKFFLRSYFVNYAINPVIYCLCGKKFRDHCKELVCGKLRTH